MYAYKLLIYKLPILLLGIVFMYFLISFTSNDVVQYTAILVEIKDQEFSEIYNAGRGEAGSWFLLWIFAQVLSVENTFYSLAVIALLLKYYIFSKYLHYPILAFIGYTLVFAHIIDANQIREAFAVCLIFLALVIEPKRKYTYLLLTSAGILFHYSAILILTLYFVRKFSTSLILIIFISFYFTTIVTLDPSLSFTSIWISKIPDQVNFTSSLFIMQTMISISALLIWGKLSNIQKRATYFNTIGIVVYLIFYEYPIIAHRVREVTQIGIIPLLFFDKFKVSYASLIWSTGLLYYVFYSMYMIIAEVNTKYSVF